MGFGWMGERLKPPDCKSGAPQGVAGSNPALSTMFLCRYRLVDQDITLSR